jgi:hypothetical protein
MWVTVIWEILAQWQHWGPEREGLSQARSYWWAWSCPWEPSPPDRSASVSQKLFPHLSTKRMSPERGIYPHSRKQMSLEIQLELHLQFTNSICSPDAGRQRPLLLLAQGPRKPLGPLWGHKGVDCILAN